MAVLRFPCHLLAEATEDDNTRRLSHLSAEVAAGLSAGGGPDRRGAFAAQPRIEDCLGTDPKGKVGKATRKTGSDETANCGGTPPDYGLTDSATVNGVAIQKELDLIHELFGSDLDAVIAPEVTDKPSSKCQQAVAKAVKLKEFNIVGPGVQMSWRKAPFRNSGFRKLKPFAGYFTHES